MTELTHLERLIASRDRLDFLLSEADERTAPAISREYRAVLAEIAALGAPAKGSKADELAKKRRARRSAS